MSAIASNSTQRGATLLEVMVALGILATSYVALLQVHGGAIRLSAYSRQVTIATFLARDKMEEITTKLDKEGFPDMDESEEGDFEEEGFPRPGGAEDHEVFPILHPEIDVFEGEAPPAPAEVFDEDHALLHLGSLERAKMARQMRMSRTETGLEADRPYVVNLS